MNRPLKRLWVRLTLAFIVVTELSILIIALLATWSINGEFKRYVFRRDVSTIESKQQDLITFYEKNNGNWQGVDRLFFGSNMADGNLVALPDATDTDHIAIAASNGQVQVSNILIRQWTSKASTTCNKPKTDPLTMITLLSFGPSHPSAPSPENVSLPSSPAIPGIMQDVTISAPIFMVADTSGVVVFDRRYQRIGSTLSPEERSDALPLFGPNNTPIGLIVPQPPDMNFERRGPEQDFLRRLQNSLLIASLIVGGLGIILGLILSRTMTAPLASLARTARAFASHDWSRRVTASGATEIAEVATAFNEMADELQRAEIQRRNMIADIAHELRTPLTVMQGNLRALLDGVYPLEPAEIATLYDETRVLSRLVDDLRELALADAGRLTLHIDQVNVSDLLNSTAASFAFAAENQNLSIELEIPQVLPSVQADVDRTAQILRNLVANSLRHTIEGKVKLTAKFNPSQKQVVISVTDTGEGISPDELPHVFDRFYRGDKSRTRTSGGTGLGLAIAKAWVEAMGGKIGVDSTQGVGSRFWFSLPAAT